MRQEIFWQAYAMCSAILAHKPNRCGFAVSGLRCWLSEALRESRCAKHAGVATSILTTRPSFAASQRTARACGLRSGCAEPSPRAAADSACAHACVAPMQKQQTATPRSMPSSWCPMQQRAPSLARWEWPASLRSATQGRAWHSVHPRQRAPCCTSAPMAAMSPASRQTRLSPYPLPHPSPLPHSLPQPTCDAAAGRVGAISTASRRRPMPGSSCQRARSTTQGRRTAPCWWRAA